jgi:hypothetical protein
MYSKEQIQAISNDYSNYSMNLFIDAERKATYNAIVNMVNSKIEESAFKGDNGLKFLLDSDDLIYVRALIKHYEDQCYWIKFEDGNLLISWRN